MIGIGTPNSHSKMPRPINFPFGCDCLPNGRQPFSFQAARRISMRKRTRALGRDRANANPQSECPAPRDEVG
jgi:hypothetical protein